MRVDYNVGRIKKQPPYSVDCFWCRGCFRTGLEMKRVVVVHVRDMVILDHVAYACYLRLGAFSAPLSSPLAISSGMSLYALGR